MTPRQFNTYQILIYTLSLLIIELLNEMKADDKSAIEIKEVLQKRVDLIGHSEVNGLFTKTKIILTLKDKFQYIINKEFDKMRIQLAKRK